MKISYIDTIIQSIGIAVGFYSFVSIWDVLVLLAISFLSKREFSSYMENPVEYYLICYGVKCVELLIVAIIGLLAKKRFQFKNTIWHDWLRAMLFPLTTTFCSVMLFQIYEIESNAGTELLLCEIVLLFFDVMAIWVLDYMDQQQAALERFGWPPTCTSILYQPERPLELYDKTDLQNIKGTQIKNK